MRTKTVILDEMSVADLIFALEVQMRVYPDDLNYPYLHRILTNHQTVQVTHYLGEGES